MKTSKPFVELNGTPLLLHTVQALQESPVIRWIILVVRASAFPQAKALLSRHALTKARLCIGGTSRAESVARGFADLPPEAQWVLVHDGARPCISDHVLRASVRAAKRYGAVACGLPAMVTVKAVDERRDVRLTLDRDRLWLVQTPQVFRRDWFARALAQSNHHLGQFPDDAALVESAGFPVRMIPGDPFNIKVTTPDDLMLAEAVLAKRRQSALSGQQSAKRNRQIVLGDRRIAMWSSS